MLRFSYLDEALTGPPPPTLPASSVKRWRPLVPVTIRSVPGQARHFRRALVDPGSDDTVFPIDVATLLGIVLRPDSGHRIRWRGQLYPLRFGDVELEISDGASTIRWLTVVAFTAAQIRYPLLGNAGCLENLNVSFLGVDRIVEIDINTAFKGMVNLVR
jgi:hypothetical protein